jgi:hypothetical protein
MEGHAAGRVPFQRVRGVALSDAVVHGKPAYGGDLDSTEIRFRRMRAEDHHPR